MATASTTSTTSTTSAPSVTSETFRPAWAYAVAAAIIGLALFASGTPSPLYGTYRAMWGLSPSC
jgi:hypothetical protein